MTNVIQIRPSIDSIDWNYVFSRLIEVYGNTFLLWIAGLAVLGTGLFFGYGFIKKKFLTKPKDEVTKEILKDQLHVLASTLMTAISLISERTREYNPPEKVDIFINIFYQGTLLDIFCLDLEKIFTAHSDTMFMERDILEKISQSFELGVTEADREANKIANVKEAMITTQMKLDTLREIFPHIVKQIVTQSNWGTARDDIRIHIKNVMKTWTIR